MYWHEVKKRLNTTCFGMNTTYFGMKPLYYFTKQFGFTSILGCFLALKHKGAVNKRNKSSLL